MSDVLLEARGIVKRFGRVEAAHLLCHPTHVAFRGDELLCANLGRWHVTAIDAGVALPPGGLA